METKLSSDGQGIIFYPPQATKKHGYCNSKCLLYQSWYGVCTLGLHEEVKGGGVKIKPGPDCPSYGGK